MPYPSPPWHLRGNLWLSLFMVRSGSPERPAGLYGAAFVDYQPGGVLTYQELLVARLVRDGAVPRSNITDIWVNSVASREGGRSLWAIPKDLCDLEVEARRKGPVGHTRWSAEGSGTPIARARFTGVPGVAPRTPYSFSTFQPREDGTPVVASASGTGRTLPCTGSWRFGTDSPLSWLSGRKPVASFWMSDFKMTFGA